MKYIQTDADESNDLKKTDLVGLHSDFINIQPEKRTDFIIRKYTKCFNALSL